MALNKKISTISVPGLFGEEKIEAENFGELMNKAEGKLSNEELLYLSAVDFGDTEVVADCLEDETINPNTVDYMGRNALILAISKDNLVIIDMLLDKLSFYAIQDGLLHAISRQKETIVKLIICHSAYSDNEESQDEIDKENVDRSQFSPDITPLILACHYNNHEIIQLFLMRGQKVEKPHPLECVCEECKTSLGSDMLNFYRSRLHKYQALASPVYMALANDDPIATSFELRQEMQEVAESHKEFKQEYLRLIEQCMQFANDILDLCRTSKEVDALLADGKTHRPLATLHKAIKYEEKKFVAHPNCQNHLSGLYYGDWQIIREVPVWKRNLVLNFTGPIVLPIMNLLYLFMPDVKPFSHLKVPVMKFINHSTSYMYFLLLLTVVTFGLHPGHVESDNTWETTAKAIFYHNYRTADLNIMTVWHYAILVYVAGVLLNESVQVYRSGFVGYVSSMYNWLDSIAIALYIASFALRIITDLKITSIHRKYQTELGIIRDCIYDEKVYLSLNGTRTIQYYNDWLSSQPDYYYIKGARAWWDATDPLIVSDSLFGVANVLSFARLTSMMPAFESVGPLQISLIRMMSDIARFLSLFGMVFLAFVVGVTNLYTFYNWYLVTFDVYTKTFTSGSMTESFKSLPTTFLTLFWALFGMSESDAPLLHVSSESELVNPDAFQIPATVGTILYGLYMAIMNIVLLNMLIGMMSESYTKIQEDADVEWKFSRTQLWLSYTDETLTLPPPFNLLPSVDIIKWLCCRKTCKKDKEEKQVDVENMKAVYVKDHVKIGNGFKLKESGIDNKAFEKRSNEEINKEKQLNHEKLRKDLVRRYLFKLEREHERDRDVNDSTPQESDDLPEDEGGNRRPSYHVDNRVTDSPKDILRQGSLKKYRDSLKRPSDQSQMDAIPENRKPRSSVRRKYMQPHEDSSSSRPSNRMKSSSDPVDRDRIQRPPTERRRPGTDPPQPSNNFTKLEPKDKPLSRSMESILHGDAGAPIALMSGVLGVKRGQEDTDWVIDPDQRSLISNQSNQSNDDLDNFDRLHDDWNTRFMDRFNQIRRPSNFNDDLFAGRTRRPNKATNIKRRILQYNLHNM